jgi:hypothetical protein
MPAFLEEIGKIANRPCVLGCNLFRGPIFSRLN